jgi:hypothetical protein
LGDCAVEGLGQERGALVVVLGREQLERGPEREKLAQRVPSQVVLLQKLLDVARR